MKLNEAWATACLKMPHLCLMHMDGTVEAEASSMTWLKQLDDHNPKETDHDHAYMPLFVPNLSAYEEATVSYIAVGVMQLSFTMEKVFGKRVPHHEEESWRTVLSLKRHIQSLL